jgi:histidinol dehydrogenase
VLALDVLAQAEHGEGSMVVAISASGELIDAIGERIEAEPDSGAIIRLVTVSDLEQALAISETFAPEHLQLVGPDVEALAPRVRHAGSLFVGPATGTAFGDYIAGSNHVLPTNGAARFASALSPMHFRRRFTETRIDSAAAELAAAAAPIARAEGFELHARSMEARNPGRPA